MSTPPCRWLDGDEPHGLGRSLLQAGARDTLDPARRARLWQSISAQLPTPPDGDQGPHDPGSPPAGDHAPSGTSGPIVSPETISPSGASARATPPGTPAPAAPSEVSAPAAPSSASTSSAPSGAPAPAAPSGTTAPAQSGTSGHAASPPLPAPAGASSLLPASGAKVLAWTAMLGLTALAGYWVADPIGFSPRRPTTSEVAPAASPAIVIATATPTETPALPASAAASGAPVASAAPRRIPATEARGLPGADEPAARPADTTAPTAEPVASAPTAGPAASAQTPAETAAVERANRLREEAEMVRQARAALRGGNAGEALRTLAATQAKFGGGGLSQEREALTIEALGQSGQRDQARARAEAFLRAYPTSPHAADVLRFAR